MMAPSEAISSQWRNPRATNTSLASRRDHPALMEGSSRMIVPGSVSSRRRIVTTGTRLLCRIGVPSRTGHRERCLWGCVQS